MQNLCQVKNILRKWGFSWRKNFNIKANQIFQQQISLLRNNFMHYFRLKERFAEKIWSSGEKNRSIGNGKYLTVFSISTKYLWLFKIKIKALFCIFSMFAVVIFYHLQTLSLYIYWRDLYNCKLLNFTLNDAILTPSNLRKTMYCTVSSKKIFLTVKIYR